MDEDTILDIEIIKKRAISGVVTLTLRNFFIFVFSSVSWFVLTIILDKSDFGIFFVVQSMLSILVYFSDIGLAGALIQKKENLTKTDLSTTFVIQQTIILIIVFLGLIFSARIASFYNLDHQGLTLFRVLVFSLFLSSLKTIPSILLERELKFTRFIIPQIAEQVAFFGTAVILASLNFRIASFYWAVLLRGFVGLVLMYILSPWKPSFSFSYESAKKLVKFGFPFQLNSTIALLKDDLLVLFLGKVLPFSQIANLGWAQKISKLPLNFSLDNVNRVTFPAYSRLQENKDLLKKAIEKSLFFITYIVFPSVIGIAAVSPLLITIIPKYGKYAEALPLLYLFSITSIIAAISSSFTNALFAIGKPKIVLKLMVFWTTLTWLLTIPLVLKFGTIGVGIAQVIVSLTSLSTIYFVKKEVNVSVGRNIIGTLSASILMVIFVKSLLSILPASFFSLVVAVTSGGILYFVMTFVIFKNHIKEDFFLIIKSFLKPN